MKRILLCAAAAAALLAASAREYEWSWRMPGAIYQNLEFTLRATVDRATRIFSDAWEAQRRGTPVPELVPRFRAAGAEWKKVQIQAEAEGFDESLLAYVIFMQGFSSHYARDRNAAIKSFTEVIDLYPEEIWSAYAARYWLGTTKIGMGDVRAGEAVIDELIDIAGSSNEKIVACAMNDRAGRLWGARKEQQAIELWKRVQKTFKEVNHWTWCSANGSLGYACGVTGDWEGMQEAIFWRNDERDPKRQLERKVQLVNDHLSWYINGMRYHWVAPLEYFHSRFPKESERKKKIAAYVQGMSAWAKSQKALFDETGRTHEAEVLAFRASVVAERPKDLVAQAEHIRSVILQDKDDRRVNALLRSAAMTLCSMRMHDVARPFADAMRGAIPAGWLRYDIEREANNWKAAAMALDELIPRLNEDAGAQRNARYALGWVCRDGLHDYERAIKAYKEIDDPPRQLWEISTAYRRAKKNKEAYNALREITMFPNDAPEAIYRIAEWQEQDGNKKKAIAFYRQLLTQPQWKKSAASSRAHQALERLGIATGGAMVNTVR